MEKVILKPQTFAGTNPVLMVSCGEGDKTNIITIAWTGIVNSVPPMLYISVRKERYSYSLIEKSGEFVVNTVDEKLISACNLCGVRSGKNSDKFAECGLTKGYNILKTPYIAESPISCECKVVQKVELPTHTMFIAEILSVIADGSLAENGKVDLVKSGIISYTGGGYYYMGSKINLTNDKQ